MQNYTAGNPAPVLYIKNLAKDVVADDFYFIFGELKSCFHFYLCLSSNCFATTICLSKQHKGKIVTTVFLRTHLSFKFFWWLNPGVELYFLHIAHLEDYSFIISCSCHGIKVPAFFLAYVYPDFFLFYLANHVVGSLFGSTDAAKSCLSVKLMQVRFIVYSLTSESMFYENFTLV